MRTEVVLFFIFHQCIDAEKKKDSKPEKKEAVYLICVSFSTASEQTAAQKWLASQRYISPAVNPQRGVEEYFLKKSIWIEIATAPKYAENFKGKKGWKQSGKLENESRQHAEIYLSISIYICSAIWRKKNECGRGSLHWSEAKVPAARNGKGDTTW